MGTGKREINFSAFIMVSLQHCFDFQMLIYEKLEGNGLGPSCIWCYRRQ